MVSRFRWSRTPEFPIGLDLGRVGLRLVQLGADSGRLVILHSAVWAREDLEPEQIDPEIVAERLARFAQHGGFLGRDVVISVGAPDVELHPLDLPTAKDRTAREQLDKAAAWEIQRLTTLDHANLQTAVWELPESRRSKATYMGVAAPSDRVRELYETCIRAKLQCVKIDVAACALAALVWRLRHRPPNQVWGVLDLGECHSRLIICIDDSPVMVRAFDVGGRSWTQDIADGLKLSLDAAQHNKERFGLGCGDEHAGANDWAALLQNILEADLKRLALETERSYEYVLQCYAPRVPGDLVLVGGGARFKGLDRYLETQLGVKVLPVGQCPADEVRAWSAGLADSAGLETCALACALSMQGNRDA